MTIQIEDTYRGLSYRVDFINSHYPWQIREGIRKALSLAGHTEDMIDEVFGIAPDMKRCETELVEDPYHGENIVYYKDNFFDED